MLKSMNKFIIQVILQFMTLEYLACISLENMAFQFIKFIVQKSREKSHVLGVVLLNLMRYSVSFKGKTQDFFFLQM